MNKMLQELINIKTFRKNRAEIEFATQKKNVEIATNAFNLAREELARYVIESTAKEKALFQRILNKAVKLRKIEDMHHEVAILREGVMSREEKKRDAETEMKVSQKRLHQAQADYQFALRIEEKFLEMGRIDDQEALREAERLSDLELEEMPYSIHHIDEWEYHHE